MSQRRPAITAAENFRIQRVKAGLSVSELARRAGVTPRTIYRIEAGTQTDPRMSTVRAVADALGVGTEDLMLTAEQVSA